MIFILHRKLTVCRGSRRLVTFFCFAKKSNQKRRSPIRHLFEVPCVARLVRRLRNSHDSKCYCGLNLFGLIPRCLRRGGLFMAFKVIRTIFRQRPCDLLPSEYCRCGRRLVCSCIPRRCPLQITAETIWGARTDVACRCPGSALQV